MPRTCIICGEPAGSREHIFPAALGGRRTNKGIYCGNHNNAYSGLAGIITEQLRIFNAKLGVIGDHADSPTSVTMTDVASGQEVELRSDRVLFKGAKVLSERVESGQTIREMAFSNRKEADEWAAELKAQGVDVQFIGKGRKAHYHGGTAHKQITLGGNHEGLRSIGYIAQTFFAHSFPEIARPPGLQEIKEYTLNGIGGGCVWWEFDPPTSLSPNNFQFGHRVLVGIDGVSGLAYARISLFSALDFAIVLGTAPVGQSRTIITDIDPLAKSPPNDITTWSLDDATCAVSRPDNSSVGLANAICNGRAQAQIHELMRRIIDFERDMAAARLMEQIDGASALPDPVRDALFAEIVSAEAQRVLNLMSYVAKDLKARAVKPVERAMAGFMENATKLDPMSENGLSAEASRALTVACEALAKQMSKECKAETLDQDRMSMLIGGGPGGYTVGTALTEIFVQRYPA